MQKVNAEDRGGLPAGGILDGSAVWRNAGEFAPALCAGARGILRRRLFQPHPQAIDSRHPTPASIIS